MGRYWGQDHQPGGSHDPRFSSHAPTQKDHPLQALDAELRALGPSANSDKQYIGSSVYLEVTPNGSKLWRWKYRLAGHEYRFALGAFPEASIAGAMEGRDATVKLVKAGIHPSH